MSKAPTITITGIDPVIQCSARILLWSELREVIERAGCTHTEQRIGLITKRFQIRGDLQEFIRIVWSHPAHWARDVRDMLERAARG